MRTRIGRPHHAPRAVLMYKNSCVARRVAYKRERIASIVLVASNITNSMGTSNRNSLCEISSNRTRFSLESNHGASCNNWKWPARVRTLRLNSTCKFVGQTS